MTIFKKGLLLVTIPLLAQVLFLSILVGLEVGHQEALRLAIHSRDVIAQAESTYRLVAEAHSGVRGLVLTGDPVFAKAYGTAEKKLPGALKALEGLVADRPEQQARAQEVAVRARRLMAWLDETIAQVRAGAREEAAARLKTLEGKRLIDELRAALDDFLAEEERLNADRTAALHRSSVNQGWTLAAGGVLALATTGVLLWLFTRGIAGRLAVLSNNARRLAAGKEMAAPLAGQDELAELDRVFHEMAGALDQKDRENEMFVYSVSHDLRSPLVNLQGFSQELATICRELRGLLTEGEVPAALRDRALPLLDRDAAESVYFIQTAVTRLAGIIDALLRLSRAGRVEYRRQAVDVRAAVVRVVEALRGTLAAKGAQVAVGDLPPAWGDPTALEQVFANLIGNAVNYLDPARPGRIEVGSADADPTAPGLRTYYIKDNGLGIPAGQQEKVFLAFQRLHPEAAPGEGIGLALVRRAVERHGGRVWVESAPGAGSVFFVALPTVGAPEKSEVG